DRRGGKKQLYGPPIERRWRRAAGRSAPEDQQEEDAAEHSHGPEEAQLGIGELQGAGEDAAPGLRAKEGEEALRDKHEPGGNPGEVPEARAHRATSSPPGPLRCPASP